MTSPCRTLECIEMHPKLKFVRSKQYKEKGKENGNFWRFR